MFSAIRTGSWREVVAPKQREDFKISDLVSFFEFDEGASRYTNSPSLTFRIISVATHFSDMMRIPHGFFLITFEAIPPVVNPPVTQFIPIAKDARIPVTPRPQSRWPY